MYKSAAFVVIGTGPMRQRSNKEISMQLTLKRPTRYLTLSLATLGALVLSACGTPDSLPTGSQGTTTAVADARASTAVDVTAVAVLATTVANNATATLANMSVTATPTAETSTAEADTTAEATPGTTVTIESTEVTEIEGSEPFTGTDVLTDTGEITGTADLTPNRVATAIAASFGVPVEQVMALHQQGQGYGEIARAYFLADELAADGNQAGDLSAEQILAMHQEGLGWGRIIQTLGLPLGNKNRNLGQIMSGHGPLDNPTVQPTQSSTPIPMPAKLHKDEAKDKRGNGGGNGKGSGNGNGKGSGKKK
jgi:hypothetical protein